MTNETTREKVERLINYLDAEAEHEFECAQEQTELLRILRGHEVAARTVLREHDALLAENEALKAKYEAVTSERPYIVGWNHGFDYAEHADETREVPDVVEMLVQERLKAAQVACVEPLEWEDHFVSNGSRAISYSVAPSLTYRIEQKFFPETHFHVTAGEITFTAGSLPEAKSVAQADNEQRILSAITMRSEAEVKSRAIREFCENSGILPSHEALGLPEDVKKFRENAALKRETGQ